MTGNGPDSEGLENLLTPMRARLLLRVGTPTSMSQLAAALYVSPSTATYQVAALASAGLVVRNRRHSTVYVERSPLGHALLRLYGFDDGRRRPETCAC